MAVLCDGSFWLMLCLLQKIRKVIHNKIARRYVVLVGAMFFVKDLQEDSQKDSTAMRRFG